LVVVETSRGTSAAQSGSFLAGTPDIFGVAAAVGVQAIRRKGPVEAPLLAICLSALKGNDSDLLQAYQVALETLPASELFAPAPESC